MSVNQAWKTGTIGEGVNRRAVTWWIVDGTDVLLTAKDDLGAATPALYNNLWRKDWEITKRLNDDTWLGRVVYGVTEAPAAGNSTFEFDTDGGTQQQYWVNTADQTGYAVAGPTPNISGALGVKEDNGDKSVEGIERVWRQYAFSEKHDIDDANVTAAYKLDLFNGTGTVNDATFKGFAAGEVLFLGTRGSKLRDDLWEISFRFVASKNLAAFSIGAIAGVTKTGWQNLEIHWGKNPDTPTGIAVPYPRFAYVSTIYESTDFSLLGIGV